MKATEMKPTPTPERGFSLIELMIAMVVTLIITGAIYGLLAGANSAFRREPELADRQQNTRVAMAMIENDIANAGMGLPPFVQVFANDGLNGQGPNGEDALEIIVGMPQCPATPVCARGADSAPFQVLETPIDFPACVGLTKPGAPVGAGTPPSRLGAAIYGLGALVGPVSNDGAAGTCGVGNNQGTKVGVQNDSGPAWWRPLTPIAAGDVPTSVVPVEVVRYVIATDPNDPTNPADPNFRHLWRSVTGGRTQGANYADAPVPNPPGGNWQLVARGINDMQVQYLDGDGVLKDQPGVFAAVTDFNLIVRQVNVTLSSRVAGANIAGFSGTDMSDPNQIRLGQLTGQIVPRQALLHLQTAGAGQQWQ